MSKKSIQETVQKELPEFTSEVVGLSVEQLNFRLAQLAKDLEDIEAAKEADDELERFRKEVSILSAPYRQGKKNIRLKSKYLVSLIREKGGE